MGPVRPLSRPLSRPEALRAMTSTQATGFDFAHRTPLIDEFDRNRLTGGGSAYLRPSRAPAESRDLLRTHEPHQRQPPPSVDSRPTNISKWEHWMVNDGGTYIFFAVWIFIQLLVAIFGFTTYQLKDNFENARAAFGVTYGEYLNDTVFMVDHEGSPL